MLGQGATLGTVTMPGAYAIGECGCGGFFVGCGYPSHIIYFFFFTDTNGSKTILTGDVSRAVVEDVGWGSQRSAGEYAVGKYRHGDYFLYGTQLPLTPCCDFFTCLRHEWVNYSLDCDPRYLSILGSVDKS